MAINENKTRINVTMSKEMAAKVKAYAERMGISQGQLITSIIGQYIYGMDNAQDMLKNALGSMIFDRADEGEKDADPAQSV